MPPTVFLGDRTVETHQWTLCDSEYAMALEDYEAGLCGGCGQSLSDSTDQANEGRYTGTVRVCHGCVGMDHLSKQFEDHDHPGALRLGVSLPPPELKT